MRYFKVQVLPSVVWLLAACAGTPRPAPVTPAELHTLDAERTRFAQDPEILTRIGIRFYEAKSYDRAEDVLKAALTLRPAFTTAVYLGLTQEALGRFDEAGRSYRTAGTLPIAPDQRTELERRMAALSQARLVSEARQAIAQESALSAAAPLPNTIAVLPWSFIGSDQSLRPLGYGVPHLVVTDLSQLSSIKLVERERIQVLLDEMALTSEGRIDNATAVRAGRLLRASHVVNGVIRETAGGIRIEATVVRTSDGSIEASGGAGDRLDRLFAIEKAITLDLVGQMGLVISPAEQRALTERPIRDLQAFLAFSRGLEAESHGDYAVATRLFADVTGRDPAFGAAQRLLGVNVQLAAAAGSSPVTLARVASPVALADGSFRTVELRSAVQIIAPSTGGEVDRRTRMPFTNPRLPEALGQDNPSKLAFIGEVIILIPRP
jgi:TolB-like protein